MPHQYAHALWRSVERGMAPKKAVEALRTILQDSGKTALLPRIARELSRLAQERERKQTIVLSIAKDSDERTALAEVSELLEAVGADKSDIETRVDESLIGGWRFEGREMLVDASYKKQLLSMYNAATK